MLGELLSGLFGGLLGDRLAKLLPPRGTSQFDSIGQTKLDQRNRWIEVTSSFIFWCGLLINFFALASIGLNGNGWRIAFLFCSPMTLTLLFIYVVTLPQGNLRSREFWRYHELRHRTRFELLISIYGAIAAVGLVSIFLAFPMSLD